MPCRQTESYGELKMTDQTPAAQKQVVAPYTSWKSALNVADRFRDSGGLPPRIDRSVLGGSEGQKTQIIATLRFFGWLKENGDVTEAFTRFVMGTDKERHAIMKELLASLYPEASRLAGVNGTTRQLEETFTGLSGDTLRKAVAFYLHASKYAGHPTSKHFKLPSFIARSNGARGGRRQATGSALTADDEIDDVPAPATDPKTRYLEMLMQKAAESEQLDTTLLDRIEKLLGFDTDKQG